MCYKQNGQKWEGSGDFSFSDGGNPSVLETVKPLLKHAENGDVVRWRWRRWRHGPYWGYDDVPMGKCVMPLAQGSDRRFRSHRDLPCLCQFLCFCSLPHALRNSLLVHLRTGNSRSAEHWALHGLIFVRRLSRVFQRPEFNLQFHLMVVMMDFHAITSFPTIMRAFCQRNSPLLCISVIPT